MSENTVELTAPIGMLLSGMVVPKQITAPDIQQTKNLNLIAATKPFYNLSEDKDET